MEDGSSRVELAQALLDAMLVFGAIVVMILHNIAGVIAFEDAVVLLLMIGISVLND